MQTLDKNPKNVPLPNFREHAESQIQQGQPTILSVQDLNIHYGSNHAVQHVSFEIPKRAVTALIGPSGCGKSTFIRSINRMNDIIPSSRTEGNIMYEDVDLVNDPVDVTALRSEIGMVFQKPNPFPKSIYLNIAHALRLHGVRKKKDLDEKVESALRDAALWEEVKDRLDTSALSLSGGQQQRLCIARMLAMRPRVLLLDEPAASLDPIATSKIENLIDKWRENYTIIIVTHNMQQAARVSDNTAFFLNGRLVEYEDTNQLFMNPGQKETEDYISGRFG